MTTSNESVSSPLVALLDQIESDHRRGQLKPVYESVFGTHTVQHVPAQSGSVEGDYLDVGFILPGEETYAVVDGSYGVLESVRRYLE